ncbi:MAG: 4'-phosphopantetheinyl transferase superfamily protein [Ilumatobacter sp.]|uniref:4'-phosphopantetheinyl transferase family protein n=1 Tax=Ilumatobacter sp. TaxID=1967498 RepID=UPI00261366AB|nr:4'-phosphopantetheinyl transferase family protein [Ilumatobacter sp.]MDJ0768068.1 4'-phosphopantetheinyl transferase superfamily protein [Ilumatobacter sp.]
MAEVPAHDAWLTEVEAARLNGLRYPKRRDEARLGRWTAKRAVAAALGRDDAGGRDHAVLRELVIRNASDGAPEVFVGDEQAPVRISMTDRADWAVCTVIDDEVDIGCDLEIVEPRSHGFVRDWFTSVEHEMVASCPDHHDLLANLIWSAKESALKVLRTGLRRDTRSVEVRLDGWPATAQPGRWDALSVVDVEGARFAGWWHRFGDFVLTYASASPTPQPEPLVEPSPLHAAQPSHRWMEAPD